MVNDPCSSCGGTGRKLDGVGGTFPCQQCYGTGFKQIKSRRSPQSVQRGGSVNDTSADESLDIARTSAALGLFASIWAFHFGSTRLKLDQETALYFTAAVGLGVFVLLVWPLRRFVKALTCLIMVLIAITFLASLANR